ncbi:hypothetical protein LWI29_031334 [Acer saccharum]|uniref:Uncharacterized protein n=1 Tax=Acer saccharum TaxID=4024 RepID=A0AA39SDQ5_ACESA|nr:hypothetical protein LWI29_031334 [Acer saccharum]
MLDIQNISKEDKLFNFMSGLQTWAQTELRRQGVNDRPTAMAAAKGLVDFRTNNATSTSDKKKSGNIKKGKIKEWKLIKGMASAPNQFVQGGLVPFAYLRAPALGSNAFPFRTQSPASRARH